MSKSDLTRKRICAAAAGLFSRSGFQRVNMQDICTASGLSRGGLYRYYSGTAEVFEDVASGFAEKLQREFEDALKAGLTASEMLTAVLRQLEGEMTDAEDSLTVAMYEYCHMTGSSRMESIYRNLRETWVRFIEFGISSGEFRKVDAGACADLVIFTFEGVRLGAQVMRISPETARNMTDMIRKFLTEAPGRA